MPRNTVALGVRPPELTSTGGSQINPFQAGLDIVRMQNEMNQNRGFQLKQQAYQELGKIAVQHPNDEEGMFRDMMASPWAPFGIDYINTARQSYLALTQAHEAMARTGKVEQEIGDSAFGNFMKVTAPLVFGAIQRDASDEEVKSIVQGNLQRVLATTPAAQRQNVINATNGWTTSITGGIPNTTTPEMRKQIMLDNIVHGMIGASATADDFKQLSGAPIMQHTAAGEIPGVQAPAWAGGGFTPAPAAGGGIQFVPQGVAPGPHQPDEIMIPGTGAPTIAPPAGPYGFGGRPTAPGGNALAPPPPTPAPTAAPAPSPVPATAPVGQSMAPTQAPVSAALGIPLWDEKTQMVAPSIPGQTTISGAPAKTKTQQESATAQAHEFDTTGATEYDGAVRSLGNLEYISNGLRSLANSRFLSAGAAGQLRTEIANSLNTIGALTGYGEVVNASELATAEGITKASRLLQYSTVRGFFGGQREAAQTIASAGQAVPGIENTTLGGLLLTEELKAQANRAIDLRRWQMEWKNRNFGDLTGSKEAFDANPNFKPEKYSQKVLDDFGMGPGGFKSGDAVATAVRNGWITQKEATPYMKKHFPDWKPPTSQPSPQPTQ